MITEGRRQSENVEDRRTSGPLDHLVRAAIQDVFSFQSSRRKERRRRGQPAPKRTSDADALVESAHKHLQKVKAGIYKPVTFELRLGDEDQLQYRKKSGDKKRSRSPRLWKDKE